MLLVLGTRNRKKRGEIVEILSGLGWEFGDLTAWPDLPEVEETGTTFAENATLKAVVVAKGTGHWALGEDSGLVVPALGGAPGVYSARYAGSQGDDAANNAKLLTEMANLPDEQRGAYYFCTAALSDPAGAVKAEDDCGTTNGLTVKAVVEGRCHGVIIREARGDGGFGYDPLFLIPEYDRTFGELSATVKHALSHRGRALTRLRPMLRAVRE